MYFKRCLFSLIAAFCCFLSGPVLSISVQKMPCAWKMSSRYDSLIRGTISFKEREKFFICLQDGLKLFIQWMGHDKSRSYFTTEDMAKFFYHVADMELTRAWEMAVKTLIVKKILVGGSVDKLENEKPKQLFHLISDYEKFFTRIKREIPFFHTILATDKKVFISDNEFNKSLKRLHGAFRNIGEAYRKKGVSYSVSDFHQIADYARILDYTTSDFNKILMQAEKTVAKPPVTLDFNKTLKYASALGLSPFNREKGEQWKNLSRFLYFWGSGVFKRPVEGNRWLHFTDSFNHILSFFAIYRIYISGRDVFIPQVFSQVLKSLELAIEAMLSVRHNPQVLGFPADKFTGLVETVFSQAKVSTGFSASPLSHLTKRANRDSLSLITRALICFSLEPRPSSCQVISAKQSDDFFESFLFPDGKYVFYKNNTQKWIPLANKTFSVTPSQLESLKLWLEEFRLGVDFIRISEKRVADKYKFSHWLNGFFGYDRESRLQFGSITREEAASLSYTLLNYSAFLRFFISSYMESNPEMGEEMSISSSEWARFTDEMFPVLAALFQMDYNTELKELSPFLFEYGDLFLNSANANGKLEFNELLDLTVHLVSAQRSSQLAFQLLEADCPGFLDKNCVSQKLFLNTTILSNFPHLRHYLMSSGANDFIVSSQELLPKVITNHYELLPFFLIMQLTEFAFYAYDYDNSSQIESKEFRALIEGLPERVNEEIPYVHNNRQAEVYLLYAVAKGNLPFLMEKGDMFSSVDFSYWLTHPEEYRDLSISRHQLFAFLVNFYNLKKQFN